MSGLLEHREVVEGPEEWVDIAVVGDVVSGVVLRGNIERGQPDRVDSEVHEIGESSSDTCKIPDSISVCIRKRAGVDLVDHRTSPPFATGRIVRQDRALVCGYDDRYGVLESHAKTLFHDASTGASACRNLFG